MLPTWLDTPDAWRAQVADAHDPRLVALREFTTDKGPLTLKILAAPDGSPSFEYHFIDERGEVCESLVTYGVDSIQALLFCLTAAGDYLRRYVPTASFADMGVTALLVTDLSAVGEWRAQVTMPAQLPQ